MKNNALKASNSANQESILNINTSRHTIIYLKSDWLKHKYVFHKWPKIQSQTPHMYDFFTNIPTQNEKAKSHSTGIKTVCLNIAKSNKN